MKRVLEKLLKAVHTLLSFCGTNAGAPSGSHRTTPSPSKLDSDEVTSGYKCEETAEAINSKNNKCLEVHVPTVSLTDSSGLVEMDGQDILEPDTLAQEPPKDLNPRDDSVNKGVTEASSEGKFISFEPVDNTASRSKQPPEDAGRKIESNLTPDHQMQGVIRSPIMGSGDNDYLSDASENLAISGSTEESTKTEPSLEIVENEGSSNFSDDVLNNGESIAEIELIEEESNRIDQSVLHSEGIGVMNGKGTPTISRPANTEDSGEFILDIQDISSVDQEYFRWNRIVVEQLLLAPPPTEDVYLCINPRILARVIDDAGFGFLTSSQAEQQFSTAIGNVYLKRVIRYSDHLHVLRRCSNDGFPDCAAFLAGSVLAAYRMHSDEIVSGIAYYKHLADLLNCNIHRSHPVGFNPKVFESLWVYLHNWLREEHGRRLAMPKGDIGLKRFIALPLAHVPLRSLDIEKLPSFFAWAGYQPGDRVRRDQLLVVLNRWQDSKKVLTPTGAKALSDGRGDAVLAQVSAELESWDGSLVESASRRSGLVELHYDIEQRNPILSYLPRRPTGFPESFDDGERLFEASDDGWYSPARILPADGDLLESGFKWNSDVNGTHYSLQRPETQVIVLKPLSSYSGYLSSHRLLRGIKCPILCRNKATDVVQGYLSEVAQQQVNAVTHPNLPNGWSIFRDFTARVHIEVPTGLEMLEVDQNIELVVNGGLRLGRRWSWINGAPPNVLVSGVTENDQVKINDSLIDVGSNGELLVNEIFAKPGEYLVEAGQMRRRIEVVEPQVSIQVEDKQHASLEKDVCVKIALPHGPWTLIGNSPDQVYYSPGEKFGGALVSCPFTPCWAVQSFAGPGSSVAVFAHPKPPRQMRVPRVNQKFRILIGQWANVIYSSHIRRPRFIGLNGMILEDSIVAVWQQYVDVAKNIKRSLKRK